MSVGRTEYPHNTPEQVREYLREALAIVDELDVPTDLRAVAFEQAVGLVSRKALQIEQVHPLAAGILQPGTL